MNQPKAEASQYRETAKQRSGVLTWRRAELLVTLAAMACFLNVLPNDYCYDDILIVRDSARVNEPGQWSTIWTTDLWEESAKGSPNRDLLYRPVALSSYRLVSLVLGPAAFGQHLINLVLHALCSLLVVRLARGLEFSIAAAMLAGLIFGLLPIHTEVVASVVGRSDLLVTGASLLALLSHRMVVDRVGAVRWNWTVCAGLLLFLAMGSKESAIGIPLVIVLFDAFYCSKRNTHHDSHSWWNQRTVLRLAYLVVPVTAYLWLRFHALSGKIVQEAPATKSINVLVDAPAWQHVLGVVQLIGMYLSKMIWPAVLSIKYSANEIRLATGVTEGHVLIGIVAIVVLSSYCFIAWRRGDRIPVLLVLAFSLAYLPTSNLFVLIQVYFAERIWYLPSVWIVLLVGHFIGDRCAHRYGWCVLGLVCLLMLTRCWIRSAEWRNNGTLYAAAYRDQPHAIGPLHLYGEWLVQQGELNRGTAILNQALEIDLGLTEVHRVLGKAHAESGNIHAARWHLQMADMQIPGDGPTQKLLQRISDDLSAQDDELDALETAAEEAPRDVDAELAVVAKLRQLGRTRDALARFDRHDRDVFEKSDRWQYEYGVTLTLLDQLDMATTRYRRSLELSPGQPQVAVELAMLLLERGQEQDLIEAQDLADHAYSIRPDSPSVLVCKAELSARSGQLREAIQLYDQAINLLPPNSAQRRILEQRARALGR